ncbi:translocon beta subunit Sbh1 [Schizosaccharomyces japonicus yFS275]|uniref:Protein transport protein Sec61 subunit beta n=1 Tax=Schizosaccharomyces japonicus (strain yFS275 / FY16936) TaxID=402676 RepID=B6JUW5_SCHJY|nr:translocon beta subunit Sbh1 [Schizosaccharomyces japonicus yFS275]EEB05069.1 translocon beta subunit Sbh1 [Schizosaccharomyces japonicus yFS275]
MSSPKSTPSVKSSPGAAPGGPKSQIRRRAAAEKSKEGKALPAGPRAAGANGSTPTMLKLYTDETSGFKVDPVVVMVLSVGFIGSVFALHIIAKLMRKFSN